MEPRNSSLHSRFSFHMFLFQPLQMSEITKPYVAEESCKKTNPTGNNENESKDSDNTTGSSNNLNLNFHLLAATIISHILIILIA